MFFCPGNELFYAMLYLSYFTTGPLYMFYILAVICFPVAVLKTGIACLQVSVLIIQLRDTAQFTAVQCSSRHSSLKLNHKTFQGYLAAVNLVGIDTKEREEVKKEWIILSIWMWRIVTPIPKLQTIVIHHTCNYVNKQRAIQKLTVYRGQSCLSLLSILPFCVRSVCQDMYITLCLRILRYPPVLRRLVALKFIL